MEDGKALRFKLYTTEDFTAFRDTVDEEMGGVQWEAPDAEVVTD